MAKKFEEINSMLDNVKGGQAGTGLLMGLLTLREHESVLKTAQMTAKRAQSAQAQAPTRE